METRRFTSQVISLFDTHLLFNTPGLYPIAYESSVLYGLEDPSLSEYDNTRASLQDYFSQYLGKREVNIEGLVQTPLMHAYIRCPPGR